MIYGTIPGVDKPVSRLVLGSMVLNTDRLPFSFDLLDAYYALGGNAVDTAYVYGGGKAEPAVGRWIKERGLREQIVLVAKGAATTAATPELVTREMLISLERLGLDYADVYLMHRDNVNVPVGEFVDCLNQHREAGRIRAYGGSNWTTERLQAANDYAQKRGIPGFAASSPNFSLAHWNEPMWPDCLSASDPESRAWYRRTQMPLLAWSSQASGFFTGRFAPSDRKKPAAADVVRVWFNEGNWRRLRRTKKLAKRKDVSALQVALAYVLHQPLNIFALIGPQSAGELHTSAKALEVCLTPAELAWLDLERKTLRGAAMSKLIGTKGTKKD
jgi:aryl-alcohol dehydrogenase-like predicted oxidoreductase